MDWFGRFLILGLITCMGFFVGTLVYKSMHPDPDPPEGWVVRYRTIQSATVAPGTNGGTVVVPTTRREMYFVSPQEYGYLPYGKPVTRP